MLMNTAVLLAVVAAAYAHMAFVHPEPRQATTDIKGGPCGSAGFFEGAPVTTLAPGENTIVLRETISHRGAPMYFALSVGSDAGFQSFVLLDHVPHNDAGGTSSIWPGITGKPYNITLVIPDIDCPQCALQLANPMTDKITDGDCCGYPVAAGEWPRCSSVYHSCADVTITGSMSAEEVASSWTNPYSPQLYTQESASYTSDGKTWVQSGPTDYTDAKCGTIASTAGTATETAGTTTATSTTGSTTGTATGTTTGGTTTASTTGAGTTGSTAGTATASTTGTTTGSSSGTAGGPTSGSTTSGSSLGVIVLLVMLGLWM